MDAQVRRKFTLISIIIVFLISILLTVGAVFYLLNLRDVEVYLSNQIEDSDVIVRIWKDGASSSIPGFTDGTSNLPYSSRDSRVYKESALEPGDWVEIKVFNNDLSENYSSFSLDLTDKLILSPGYESFAFNDTSIFRVKVEGKIKIDYSSEMNFIKWLIEIIRRGYFAIPYEVYTHVEGHACEPKPTDPPGNCNS
ncbi:MAG: hypothetical protein BalsKO_10910 [Balneolaceae bacterium]